MDQKEPQQKSRKPKLTKKQKVFVAEYVISENGADAAKKAYDIKGQNKNAIAASIAKENLTKPPIQDSIVIAQQSLRDAFIEEGITPKKIAEKVNVLLEAKEKVFRNNVTTGEIEEIGEKTDFTAVDKGLKHATAVYGVNPDAPKTPTNVTYNFLFSADVQEKVRIINEQIKAKLIHAEPTPTT